MVWAATPVQQQPSPNEMDRIYGQAMLDMRGTMANMQQVLFPQNAITGQLVRMKTGLHLTERLENRLGIMGPDFLDQVNTDYDLERVGKLLDKLHPEGLAQIASELDRLTKRVCLERGDPDE
jgi:hypothetical protein